MKMDTTFNGGTPYTWGDAKYGRLGEGNRRSLPPAPRPQHYHRLAGPPCRRRGLCLAWGCVCLLLPATHP